MCTRRCHADSRPCKCCPQPTAQLSTNRHCLPPCTQVLPLSSGEVYSSAVEDLLEGRAGCTPATCYLHVQARYRHMDLSATTAAITASSTLSQPSGKQQEQQQEQEQEQEQAGGKRAGGGRRQQSSHKQLASDAGWSWSSLGESLARQWHNWWGGGQQLEPSSPGSSGAGGSIDIDWATQAVPSLPGADGADSSAGGDGSAAGWHMLHELTVLLASPKDVELQDPQVALTDFRQAREGHIGFSVSVARPALYVVWDAEVAGHFDANALVMHPCWPRNVTFHPAAAVTVGELQKRLTVQSLWDFSFEAGRR
jgi:hypothetical protein